MAVTVTFKSGNTREFPNVDKVTRKGGLVVLSASDGSGVVMFDEEGIADINSRPMGEFSRATDPPKSRKGSKNRRVEVKRPKKVGKTHRKRSKRSR